MKCDLGTSAGAKLTVLGLWLYCKIFGYKQFWPILPDLFFPWMLLFLACGIYNGQAWEQKHLEECLEFIGVPDSSQSLPSPCDLNEVCFGLYPSLWKFKVVSCISNNPQGLYLSRSFFGTSLAPLISGISYPLMHGISFASVLSQGRSSASCTHTHSYTKGTWKAILVLVAFAKDLCVSKECWSPVYTSSISLCSLSHMLLPWNKRFFSLLYILLFYLMQNGLVFSLLPELLPKPMLPESHLLP